MTSSSPTSSTSALPSLPSSSSSSVRPQARRRRSSSIKVIYDYVSSFPPAEHHLLHLNKSDDNKPLLFDTPTPLALPADFAVGGGGRPRSTSLGKGKGKVKLKVVRPLAVVPDYGPSYLRWLQHPADSFNVIATILVLYFAWEVVVPQTSTLVENYNPFRPMLFLSYRLMPDEGVVTDEVRYGKSVLDLAFLSFYVVVFSCLRQASTQFVIAPLALKLGIKKGRKLERFMEQGYAVLYFTLSSLFGLYVMKQQESWWYRTEYFFLDYPHGGPSYSNGGMTPIVKAYYLLQFSYWLQQALVMLAGLEKKRDDYIELILHHIITLWLVGVSYSINMTQIGIAIFVSMDIPDVALAISKCINYVALDTGSIVLERTGNCSFVVFMLAWGYLRHYQNIRILFACFYKYHLVPERAAVWDPANGFFLPTWARFHVFTPIFLLQLVITFWSYLILRILFRMLAGSAATDTREEAEE